MPGKATDEGMRAARGIRLSREEERLFDEYTALRRRTGSHAPGIREITARIPELQPRVDACFLSNPYAADLFLGEWLRLSPAAWRQIIENYPSQNAAIARHIEAAIGVPAERIFVGNGATEIIQGLFQRHLVGRVLLPIPTFSPYYEFHTPRSEVLYHRLTEEEGFRLRLDRLVERIERERIDHVILINPNNPNGGFIPYDEVERFVDAVHRRLRSIVIDESFNQFVSPDPAELPDYYPLALRYPNVVVVRSLSKDYGIAGLRAGYAVMDAAWTQELLASGYRWNVSGPAEFFFTRLADPEFRARHEVQRREYVVHARALFDALAEIPGLTVFPSRANFVLIKLPPAFDSDLFAFLMMKRYGVYLRSASDKIGLVGKEFIRISARTREENAQILTGVRELLAEALG